VTVERGAVVRSSVLMDGCHVAAGAVVERAILDKQVTVGREARIGGGKAVANRAHPDVLASGAVVVGKATRIPDGCEVGAGAVLAPDIGETRFAGGHITAGATVEP
jgi:glucose-1-phosphate adenylyltransferase